MVTVTGKAASEGVAIGIVREFVKKKNCVCRRQVKDATVELERFEVARNNAIDRQRVLYEKASNEVGKESASIFEVHQMMLEDQDYIESIRNMIGEQFVNAEYAVATTGDQFSSMFEEMEDAYMRERAADIKDISQQLISELLCSCHTDSDQGDAASCCDTPVIIVADDLVPSETIQLDRNRVLAFVTRKGSINSHTAILARTMNIPALVCAPVGLDVNGKMAIVDGKKGVLLLEPEKETICSYRKVQAEEETTKKLLARLKGVKSVTPDGRNIKLYANIGGVKDLTAVLQNDAEGIGLFRSEFLFLQSQDYPTEEEQFTAYKKVAEKMNGKQVIIRTLDIGADKKIDYFDLGEEENPALGYRAVRICLDRTEVFQTQLRAIYRASAYGNIAIMVPMIASVWEVKRVKELLQEVKNQLQERQIPFGTVSFGIMIETPAAVMIAEALAEEVDFFSIGTNDLTQYTLAIDRQNTRLDRFYDAHHPAVLKMIQMVIDSAHKAGIWAGICGELGADTSLTEQFLQMGIDELSVTPSMILPVRERIIHAKNAL